MNRGRRRRRSPPKAERKSGDIPMADTVGEKNDASDALPTSTKRQTYPRVKQAECFAALDLGTNNCRLLIASPRGQGFRIIDAFSRIVRLGDGLSRTGSLSENAMERCIEALKICADKIKRRGATRSRCIATQACRSASNGQEFLARVKRETGLEFDIISTEEEARLAATGCADLIDPEAKACLIFDIGGGSTEVSLIRVQEKKLKARRSAKPDIVAWFSMPLGVVNLSERYGGSEISPELYETIVDDIRREVLEVGDPENFKSLFGKGGGHFLGTSGTVTSLAGVHLKLLRYRRDAVDGHWLTTKDARDVTEYLRAMPNDMRAAEPCIGEERADLVVCGCAILEALLREWPTTRIRVADRGLREGILHDLRAVSRKRRRRTKRKSISNNQPQNNLTGISRPMID